MPGNKKRMAVARKTRSQVAQTFTRISNDGVGASELLESFPDCLKRVKIYDVLRRLPHLNSDGAQTVLRRAKVWPLVTMGNLTDAERQRILQALPPRVKR